MMMRRFHIHPARCSAFAFAMMATIATCWATAAEYPDSVTVQDIYASLPELNITSVRQQEVLRNEAVSSSVISSEDLARLGAVAVKGISEMVPNLYIPDYGSRITSSIYVRGLGARVDHPAVGMMIDNVSLLNKDSYDLDIPDMARVEVLRGPQSALYGRNTMGGLINVTTLSPFDFQGERVGATIANGRIIKGNAGWYRKFGYNHALSASILFNHQGGFRRNLYDNSLVENENSGSLRLKYQWRISNSASLQNVFSSSFLRQKGYAYEGADTHKIEYDDPCRYKRFVLSDGITLVKYHDLFTANSITSLQYIDDDLLLDQDFLPQPYFTLNQRKRELAVTQDFTIRSAAHNNSVYGWLVGVSGFWKRMRMEAPVTFKDTGIAHLIEAHRNENNPYYPIAWNGRTFVLGSQFTMPVFGFSAYHESSLSLGNFRLKGALRLEYEKTRLDYNSLCKTSYGIYENPDPHNPLPDVSVIESWPLFSEVVIDIDDDGRLCRDYLMWLPSVSAIWNFNADGSNIYASVARGAKSGGFNTQMFSEVLQQRLMRIMGIGTLRNVDETVGYRPEHSWNYELGTHLDFPSVRLQADMSVFFIDCRDQQLTMFPDGTTTGRMMSNAGSTHSYGAEVAVRYSPLSRMDVNFSYGYTHATFRRFSDGINDYSGKKLPYVPGNTLFLQLLYRFPLSANAGVLLSDLNVRFTGPIQWNEANTLCQKMYGQLGASLSWIKDNVEVQLWGRNLTDTRFYTFYFKSMGHEFLQRGKPIQFGITMSMSFK